MKYTMIRENNTFENVVSHIYDKSNDELIAIAKSIKSGAAVSPVVKMAFEKVLKIRYTEIIDVYNFYYDMSDLISLEEIKKDPTYGNEFYAVGEDLKWYDASFNRKLNVMFFCIPASVEVVGYLRKVSC